MDPSRIRPARLAQGLASDDPPRSISFDDIYHDADGAGEVKRVFMAPAGLGERFRRLDGTLTVGELGFGTGLNFAVFVKAFLEHAPAAARLHFISVEKHPLTHADFGQLARRRGSELPIYGSLDALQPPLLHGWHRQHFHDGRITLSRFYGDAFEGLRDVARQTKRPVDHWLLDGFAPDRNPEMWAAPLFERVAVLSSQGTTACTFSAAGRVRRALADVGFEVRKIDQRPHKRHSTLAVFDQPGRAFRPPSRVQVLGAGIAGCCAARALADRGIDVSLLHQPTTEPVAIPTATANPRLLPNDSTEGRLRVRSFHFSVAWLARFGAVRRSGVLQLPSGADGLARMESVADLHGASGPWVQHINPATAASISGLPLKVGGLLLRDGCTVDIGALLGQLTNHPRIELATTESIIDDELPSIFCTGTAVQGAAAGRHLELRPIWGQLELLEIDHGPRLPLTGNGVVTPAAGCYGVGSSYEHAPWPSVRARRFNLERFEAWWHNSVSAPLRYRSTGHIRGCRCVSSDRLPVIGPLHDGDGQPLEHRYVSTGHGSHGTLSAPLAADCLAAVIDGEFPILDHAESACVDGLRFFLRRQKRTQGRRSR